MINELDTQPIIRCAKMRWLDPRRRATPPISEAVNIPLEELPSRIHELPSREEHLEIANTGEEAVEVQRWLRANGRSADLGEGFEYGEPSRGRLWSPNGFLESVVPGLAPGTALDLACGSGRDAVFLAGSGFAVTAIDHLLDAIVLGSDLSRRCLADPQRIDWQHQNLDKQFPEGEFDLVTCFFYLNRPLLARAAELLKPGGSLLVETFTASHREAFGKPRSENYVLHPQELVQLLPTLRVVEYEEGWHGGKHTARYHGRKA